MRWTRFDGLFVRGVLGRFQIPGLAPAVSVTSTNPLWLMAEVSGPTSTPPAHLRNRTRLGMLE
jgi:hypothetical protein